MKNLLYKLAMLLLKWSGNRVIIAPTNLEQFVTVAEKLIIEQDILEPDNGRGEWKRHNTYAKLLKLFPNESKRALSLALELACSSSPR